MNPASPAAAAVEPPAVVPRTDDPVPPGGAGLAVPEQAPRDGGVVRGGVGEAHVVVPDGLEAVRRREVSLMRRLASTQRSSLTTS
jgi:hypothetical protein